MDLAERFEPLVWEGIDFLESINEKLSVPKEVSPLVRINTQLRLKPSCAPSLHMVNEVLDAFAVVIQVIEPEPILGQNEGELEVIF